MEQAQGLLYVSTFKEFPERNVVTRVLVTKSKNKWFTYVEQKEPEYEPILNLKYEGYNSEQAIQTAQIMVRERMHRGAEPLVPIQMTSSIADMPAISRNKLFLHKLDAYSDSHANENLVKELKKWRRKEASLSRMAPYLIASDRLIRMLATYVPHTELELIQLPGIGEKKRELYAEPLLAILKNWSQPEEFPLDWVDHQVADLEAMQWAIRIRDERKIRADRKLMEQMEQDQFLLKSIQKGLPWPELLRYMPERTDTIVNRLKHLHSASPDVQSYMESQIEWMAGGKQLLSKLMDLRSTQPALFHHVQQLWAHVNHREPILEGLLFTLNNLKLVLAYTELIQSQRSGD